jgi:hypothetical protein
MVDIRWAVKKAVLDLHLAKPSDAALLRQQFGVTKNVLLYAIMLLLC